VLQRWYKDGNVTGNQTLVRSPALKRTQKGREDVNPEGREDFLDTMLYAWCWHDEVLAGLGRKLVDLWFTEGTFTGERAKDVAREVGTSLYSTGGIDLMRMMFRPVTVLLGSEAASSLNFAWSRIGGWMP